MQLLERALEESDNDVDSAIKKLNDSFIGTAETRLDSVEELNASANQGVWLLISCVSPIFGRSFFIFIVVHA